jgi:FkbM family methyltransferase
MRSPRTLAAAAARRALSPLVPAAKMLPFMYWLHRAGGSCEPELLHLNAFCGAAGSAIDIGANQGWYTYPLAKIFKRVYAFEINDEITGWIRDYNPGNIELIHRGLSSAAGMARFYVPVARGLAMPGWGSLYADNLQGAETCIEKEVAVSPLDEFGLTGVGFIKIDVEGHELEVLKGAAATIAQSRPIVLVELKKAHVEEADGWFEERNYSHCRLEDFIGVKGHRSNHIYVPVERLAEFGIGASERPD